MNNNNINPICAMTWNIGSDYDFIKMNNNVVLEHTQFKKENVQVPVDPNDQEVMNHRDSKIQAVIKKVSPDFICLQEAPKDTDRIIKWLGNDYEFITGDKEDTLVAWKVKRFTPKMLIMTRNVVGKYFKEALYTIIDLIDNETQKVIRVASAHLTGCMNTKTYKPNDGSEEGTNQLQIIMKRMQDSTNDVDAFFVGLDANVEPTHARLSHLNNAGYILDGEQRSTIFSSFKANEYKKIIDALKPGERPNENDLPVYQRKIDHIATKHLQAIFPDRLLDLEVPVGDPRKNPSDHAPIIRNLTFQPEKKNFFNKLFK